MKDDPASKILVDTSVWIDFLNAGASPYADHLDELIDG
jgi:hypothetical protein